MIKKKKRDEKRNLFFPSFFFSFLLRNLEHRIRELGRERESERERSSEEKEREGEWWLVGRSIKSISDNISGAGDALICASGPC